MQIKTGIDIIEIERVKQSIEETDGKFCERVYTEKEIEYCESKKIQKYQHYAARFAAKEATFKAISESLEDKYELIWTDYEVLNDEEGKPSIKILGREIKELENIDLSISHCKQYAVATVVAVFK